MFLFSIEISPQWKTKCFLSIFVKKLSVRVSTARKKKQFFHNFIQLSLRFFIPSTRHRSKLNELYEFPASHTIRATLEALMRMLYSHPTHSFPLNNFCSSVAIKNTFCGPMIRSKNTGEPFGTCYISFIFLRVGQGNPKPIFHYRFYI